MPWKFLFILLLMALLIALVGVNWGNVSDFSLFGLHTFKDVPIIIVIGISFLTGSLFSIPYALSSVRQMKKKQIPDNEQKNKDDSDKKKRKVKNQAPPAVDVPPTTPV